MFRKGFPPSRRARRTSPLGEREGLGLGFDSGPGEGGVTGLDSAFLRFAGRIAPLRFDIFHLFGLFDPPLVALGPGKKVEKMLQSNFQLADKATIGEARKRSCGVEGNRAA